MKRRFHKIANFFAFNLLFFALYLNFIHKDKSNVLHQPAAVVKATNTDNKIVLLSNPEEIAVAK